MAGSGLTPKQQAFADAYIQNYNAYDAAVTAGYSEKTADSQASRLLKNVKIRAFVNAARKKVSEKSQLTAESILADVAEIKSRCMAKEAILDRQGNKTGEWKFDSNGAMKCCEFEAKYIQMFAGKDPDGGDRESFSGAIRSALGRVRGKRPKGGKGRTT